MPARALALVASSSSIGCEGPLSALSPAGRQAQEIATLFWWMVGGAALIWAVVNGLALYAIRSRPRDRNKTRLFIIGGGAVLPTLVLTVLLIAGLGRVPGMFAPGEEGGPVVRISGEQWWWRIEYALADGTRFELANELYLPVGRRVSLLLESADVVHSFWVPSLGGKMDLIPGRANRWALEPTRTGVFMGACAEYCGVSHAKMMLHVVVVEEHEFDDWARHQAADAALRARQRPGAGLFAAHGCPACHTVRGTGADGVIGPDLTHVGGRRAIGAGVLPNTADGFREWLVALSRLKPSVHMPAFDMLSDAELTQLALFLEGLE
jgi:cytochrome c oxidase subunit II